MKKHLLFSFLILMLCMFSFSVQTHAQFVDYGLVVYYPMDGNGLSGIEGGPEAQIEGEVRDTVGFNGKEGGAMAFDVMGDAMVAEDGVMVGLPVEDMPRSMAVWVNISSELEGNLVIINYGTPSSDPKGAHVHLTYRPTEGEGRVRVGHWYADYDFDGIDLRDDQWHHIVYTFDGELFVLYIDGEYQGELEVDPALEPVWTVLNGEFVMGARNVPERNDPMVGAIDEVRVYDNALTDADILAIYQYDPDENPGAVTGVAFNNVDVFPNPAQNVLNIKSDQAIENIQIMNISGQSVLESTLNSIDISDCTPGIYMVKVNTSEGSSYSKVIIE